MTATNANEPRPEPVRIPDELKQFLEAVDQLTEGLEKGTYKLDEEHTHLVDGDYLNWSFHTGIAGRGICGYPNEDRTEFEFQCDRSMCGSEWRIDLTREEIAQIASGALSDLPLYSCAHPLCRFRSSARFSRCPTCELEAGADIGAADGTVRGVCPFCRKLLRSLSARQCPHCLMDWHDPEHPARLRDKA